MTNLLEQAINSNDADHAARLIQAALGIQSDEVANYVFPEFWPSDREQRGFPSGTASDNQDVAFGRGVDAIVRNDPQTTG